MSIKEISCKLLDIKKLIVLTLKTITLFSCNPLVQMETNIVNLTTKSLSLDFISWDSSLSKTFQIDPNQSVLFDLYDGYGTYTAPDLAYYDSVLIKNQSASTQEDFSNSNMK